MPNVLFIDDADTESACSNLVAESQTRDSAPSDASVYSSLSDDRKTTSAFHEVE